MFFSEVFVFFTLVFLFQIPNLVIFQLHTTLTQLNFAQTFFFVESQLLYR